MNTMDCEKKRGRVKVVRKQRALLYSWEKGRRIPSGPEASRL